MSATPRILTGEKVSIINAILLALGINRSMRIMRSAAVTVSTDFAENILVNATIKTPTKMLPIITPNIPKSWYHSAIKLDPYPTPLS